jgi:Fic family protein
MMTFRRGLRDFKLPLSTVWLMNDIAEAKGRQELYTKQAPQILKALREMAMVESVESSNRIEGVTVAPDRLRPLVLGDARPKDRSEEEVQGYRNALQRIHAGAAALDVTPATLQLLHRTIQEGAGDAGQWKAVDNDIIEFRPARRLESAFALWPSRKYPRRWRRCACSTGTLWTRSMCRRWSRRRVWCSTFFASIPFETATAGSRDF